MGEEAGKPKVEPARRPWHQRRRQTAPVKKEKFKGPNDGLQDQVFRIGGAKEAAEFVEVKKAISRHVGIHFKVGNNMAQAAIENLVNPTIEEPADPPAPSNPPTIQDRKAEKRWEMEFETYMKQLRAWEDAEPRAFQLVLSQCEPAIEEKLEACTDWETVKRDHKLVDLLKLIQGIVHKTDEIKQGTMAYVQQYLDLCLNFQKENEDIISFFKAFKARCEVIDTFGGCAGYHEALHEQHKQALAKKNNKRVIDLDDDEVAEAKETSCEEFKACLFIRIANDKLYGGVKKAMDNKKLFKEEASYPKTMEEALRYLQNYQSEGFQKNYRSDGPKVDQGVAFMEQGRARKPCHGCGKTDHWLRNCPALTKEEKDKIFEQLRQGKQIQQGQAHVTTDEKKEKNDDAELQECLEGVANVSVNFDDASIGTVVDDSHDAGDDNDSLYGTFFVQSTSTKRGKRQDCGRNKLFLDSCATNHTMFATEHLERCHTVKVVLRQNCNAGSKLTNKMGYWGDYRFWINEDGIANLLSIPSLEKHKHYIRYTTGGQWQVVTPNGKVMTFKHDSGVTAGMPYIDLTKDPSEYTSDVLDWARPSPTIKLNENFVGIETWNCAADVGARTKSRIVCQGDNGVVFVETVRGNMEGFTAEQVRRAQGARDAMAMMAHPSASRMRQLVSTTDLITGIPFNTTDLTNGDAIFGPDRGAIRGKTVRKRQGKVRPEFVQIPPQLYERLRDVVLTADVMFVNGLPFFVSRSRAIKLITSEFLPSRTADQLYANLMKVVRLYRRGGYLIRLVLMDMEFETLKDKCEDVTINTTAAREHVSDIERAIREIKERARSVISELPFKHCMPDVMLVHLIKFVTFWINSFVNENGASKVFSPRELLTGMKVDYNKHCQARFGAYVEASDDADVTNDMRDRTSPCIVLGPTVVQGSVRCLNLATKKVVTRRTVNPLPMPDQVIRRVVKLGKSSKQLRTKERLTFLNRHKDRFDWDTPEDEFEGLVERQPL